MKVTQCLDLQQVMRVLEGDPSLTASRLNKDSPVIFTDGDECITSNPLLSIEDIKAKDWVINQWTGESTVVD